MQFKIYFFNVFVRILFTESIFDLIIQATDIQSSEYIPIVHFCRKADISRILHGFNRDWSWNTTWKEIKQFWYHCICRKTEWFINHKWQRQLSIHLDPYPKLSTNIYLLLPLKLFPWAINITLPHVWRSPFLLRFTVMSSFTICSRHPHSPHIFLIIYSMPNPIHILLSQKQNISVHTLNFKSLNLHLKLLVPQFYMLTTIWLLITNY